MNNPKQKIQYIIDTLESLYPNPEIPLHHHSIFTLLVAVVLSARSTDAMVNRVTPTLFSLADTANLMANADFNTIQKIIQPCGLSARKAHALIDLSNIILNEHNGHVPNTFEALEKLPGVGHKTASIILAEGFGFKTFPVDTHVHRLAKRWKLSSGTNVKQTERDLKAAFPESLWAKIQLQMIYYGGQYCTWNRCDGTQCLICSKLC